ncbi:endonuclease V [Sulfuricella sp. T08]|uniref:deoxyribonuclease V n=1 Tax=Sulfuricella sp. T08 TaxID=1632857 RepID=UPI000617981B|nr:deoxyribonuclease V [Sulfuricella sp. T08]GAO35333.1 endonuclease V [Sulfuricella sp. T08]
MKIVQRHPWDISPAEAIAIQQQLRGEVVREDWLGPVRHVAGVDVGFEEGGGITRAAVAVLAFPTLELVDHAIFRTPTCFPYVPGLLSFREVPAVIGALEKLTVIPDLLLCDGQGIAHPRRFGIASHLGLLCGISSIGVAKTRLIGEQVEPPDQRGASVPLRYHGETIGAILRSRPGVKPLYISIGHRISLATALDYVMACVTRYRLPETTRWAHRLASGPAVE